MQIIAVPTEEKSQMLLDVAVFFGQWESSKGFLLTLGVSHPESCQYLTF